MGGWGARERGGERVGAVWIGFREKSRIRGYVRGLGPLKGGGC